MVAFGTWDCLALAELSLLLAGTQMTPIFEASHSRVWTKSLCFDGECSLCHFFQLVLEARSDPYRGSRYQYSTSLSCSKAGSDSSNFLSDLIAFLFFNGKLEILLS